MIIDTILLILKIVVQIILSPLTAINMAIDFIGSIPVIMNFIQIVAYVLPWGNILPVIILIFTVFTFRILMALINLILKFVPFFG